MTNKTIGKYDHLRIKFDELIPTFDDMLKYDELKKGMTNNLPYFTNDEDSSEDKINKLVEELEGADYETNNINRMIVGFIAYKALQIAKENINLEDIDNDK